MFLDNTACNLASSEPAQVPRYGDRPVRRRSLPARGSALDDRARDQRADGAVPERRDRAALLRLPHARPRLRQPRHRADAARHAVRLGPGSRLRRRADRAHDRRELRGLRRDGRAAGPVPRLRRRTGSTCCASSATTAARPTTPRHPSTNGSRCCRCRSPPTTSPVDLLGAAREAWDRALAARRATRLPQRADDVARPDRHHRPADGLRHHRRRARLRAGQVQEARRRRLLQDRQPEHRAGPAQPRLLRRRAARPSSSTSSGR